MVNVQDSLSGLLQDILDTITSDCASGNFQAMPNAGMLLNSMGEMVLILKEKLSGENLATGG